MGELKVTKAFRFAQLGDPQMGMGADGLEGDRRRFLEAIRRVNELLLDFVLISGDLTHKRQPEEYAALESCIAKIEPPIRIVPGNHDILSPDDLDGLEDYRDRFGADYYGFTCGGAEFLCLDAMTLSAEDTSHSVIRRESEKQWSWLETRLSEIRARGGAPVFLFLHIPPFTEDENEPEAYFNLPKPTRARFLSLVRRYEVGWILTGHTHTTREVEKDGFALLTTAGTSLSLDERGFGFRVFDVSPKGVEQRFEEIRDEAEP
jgi:3',5'-cyclic AMP phosphodiesterase CpdA